MQLTKANGRKMRACREAADLTVDELVAKLAAAGISYHPDTIRNIELGHKQPGFKLLNAIARELDVPREELMMAQADQLSPVAKDSEVLA